MRKAAARGEWGRMSKKGKKERRSKLSNEESDDEVIRMKTGSDSDSEKEGKRGKRSAKREVRMRKVCFENKGKKKEEGQEHVDELTKKLLQLNVKDDAYAAAYAQLFILAPTITENLLLPSRFAAFTITSTSTTVMSSHPRYSSAPMPCNFTCHFCKKPECHLRTCPIAEEYVWSRQVLRQPNGYYTYLDESPIDACHPGGLKGAVDFKLNIWDIPPHLSNITSIPTKFSSFIGATWFEEDEFVWEAMTQLESKIEEADGLVTTRVQERKETAKRTDQKKEVENKEISQKGKGRVAEVH